MSFILLASAEEDIRAYSNSQSENDEIVVKNLLFINITWEAFKTHDVR